MKASVHPTAQLASIRGPRDLGPRQNAEARLRDSGYLALRGVTCVVRDEVAHLHGHLPTYYLKQVAQSLVASVEGVRSVVNHIRILPPPDRAPEGTSQVTTRSTERH